MIRLFVSQQLAIGERVNLTSEQRHYLKRVMRCKYGDDIIVFNGLGGEFQAVIEGQSCWVQTALLVDRELPLAIDIVQGACRGERMDQLLQKSTELGAASFTIVRSQRSMLKLPKERLSRRLERWRQIVVEAAEQSGRTKVPTVTWCDSLSALDLLSCHDRWLLHLQQAQQWREVRASITHSSRLALAVGPEGGFTATDITTLQKQGFRALQFGDRILRCETAAPALLAAIQALL